MDKSQRVAYGEALCKLGAELPEVVVLDADLAHATVTDLFRRTYPKRHYDFGIAEANMVCQAAGFAHAGLIPFVSTFALFGAGRAYEQVRNAVCYANANVKFGLCHAGIVTGEDGGSHQSIEDLALMRVMPNMRILAPCDCLELEKAVFAAAQMTGPVYIRIARPACCEVTRPNSPFVVGKANVLRQGADVCLMGTGLMVKECLKAAETLASRGISAAVVNHHTIKPIDRDCIDYYRRTTRAIVSAEDHSVIGGLGSAIAEQIAGKPGARFAMVGVRDVFGKSGKPAELMEAYGLTHAHLAKAAMDLLEHD